jgi:chromosome condensin MukBEF MukE localization factor
MEKSNAELDWEKAKEHLYEAQKVYTEIGMPGKFALVLFINPCLLKYEAGVRTQELYDEIMSIEL